MIDVLSKALNIRPHEWPRFILLYLMCFLSVCGYVWGSTTMQAAFLRYLGLSWLPWFFMIKAVIAIPAAAIYAALADSMPNEKLLIAIVGCGASGILMGLTLLTLGHDAIAYPLLFLVVFVPLDEIFAIHWSTYVNGFYDTRAAKRIMPMIGTSSAIAGIVAGLTLKYLTEFLPTTGIVLMWLIAVLMIAVIAWLLPYLLDEPDSNVLPHLSTNNSPLLHTNGTDPNQPPSYLENIRDGFRYVVQSSLLRWMVLSTCVIGLLLTLLDYQVSQIMLTELKSAEQMASFTGQLTGLANVVILLFQLFLLSRLINRIGVGNANLIYPIGTLLITLGLILSPTLFFAALAFFARTYFYGGVGYVTDGLLYNAIPLRMKGRARGFIGGFMMPIAGLIGGGFLAALRAFPIPGLLPTLVGLLAVALVAITLMIRTKYSQALIALLEEDFVSLLTPEVSRSPVSDPAALTLLSKRLEESTTPEMTLFFAKLASEVGGSDAVPMIAQAARSATDPRIRAAILDTLTAEDLQGDMVVQLFTEFLKDPAGIVRQSAIVGLEQSTSLDKRPFLSLVRTMVQDPDLRVRLQVLSVLAQSGKFYTWPDVVESLQHLLTHDEPALRAHGVRVLSQIRDERAIEGLLPHLDHADDQIRLNAVLGIEAWAKAGLPESLTPLIRDHISQKIHDPVYRVRQSALTIVGYLGTPDAYHTLICALDDPILEIRQVAIDSLVQLGKSVAPDIQSHLDTMSLKSRKMATLVLCRIKPREFAALLQVHICQNLEQMYGNQGQLVALSSYDNYPAISVLECTLKEYNRKILDELFYLFTGLHQRRDLDLIFESLQNQDEHIRANATEALEAMTSPQIARLIAPLCDPTIVPDQLLTIGKEAWDLSYPTVVGTMKDLFSAPDDPWVRAVMTFALGDMSQVYNQALPTRHVPFTLQELKQMIQAALRDPDQDVRLAARSAKRMLTGMSLYETVREEAVVLSTIERMIFLKGIPFFQGMTVEQLKVLANVCDEARFPARTPIVSKDDPGGILYVIVSGRVSIEQEKRRGYSAHLAMLGAYSYFGETNLFDASPHTAHALALQDTLTLRLRREPIIMLARQYPDLSLELINELSRRLREANDRIVTLTRARPTELQKFYDQFG